MSAEEATAADGMEVEHPEPAAADGGEDAAAADGQDPEHGEGEGQEAAGPYLVARLTGDGSEAVTGGRARWAARAEVGTDGGCTGWRERSEAWCERLAVDEDGYVVWLEGGGG